MFFNVPRYVAAFWTFKMGLAKLVVNKNVVDAAQNEPEILART